MKHPPASLLQELAKKHKDWIHMANYICKDPHLSEDLVQDMYIKLAKYAGGKEINEWYVFVTIKNLFYNHCKERKQFTEIDERILAQPDEDSGSEEKMLQRLEEELKEVHWYDRQLVLMKQNKSPRVIQKEIGINYQHIYRNTQKTEDKLRRKLADDFELYLKDEL